MNATQVLITIAVILAIVIMLFWLFGHNRADAGVGPRFHASTLLPRAPLPDEVQLNIFQYATGDHPVPVACANSPADGHVHGAPVYHLQVDRPFEYRIEPRWKGGSEPLDLIFEVKVDSDVFPTDSVDGDGFSNAWSQLTHLGPQTKNREMAQIGQHVTFGRGRLLHPMPGFPILYHFRVDFQLGSQSGPKRVCEGRVLVSRAEPQGLVAGPSEQRQVDSFLPRGCDIVAFDDGATSYCETGRGFHRPVAQCQGHHVTTHFGPWAPVEQSSFVDCPAGETVVGYQVVTRTRMFAKAS